MATWVDRMLGRARNASSDYELEQVKRELEQHLPPSVVNGSDSSRTNDMGLSLGGGDDGTHLHLHLGAGGQAGGGAMMGGGGTGDQPTPQNGPAPPNAAAQQGGDLETRLAALEAAVATLTQQMNENGGGSEEEVQLEDPNSKDARPYILRRGDKIRKIGDEELIVPAPEPDIIYETDLPGIEDLDARMNNATGDRAKTGDSFNMESVWQDTMAKAEIIVPGIRVPTFDGRITQERTTARLCAFRRQTLDAALKDTNTADIVTNLTDIKNSNQIRHLSCDSTRMAFNVIAGAIGGNRNMDMVRATVGDRAMSQPKNPTIAEMQRRNREAWKTGKFVPPT